MKKFLVLLFITLLTSCSTSTKEWAVTWLVTQENKDFTISLPENWDVISNTWNTLPKPKNWDIALAVASKELKYGFTNNMLIMSQSLDKQVTSLDFSILNNVWSTKEYLEYTKLESKSLEFADSDKSNLYIFEAKYNIKTPKLKFLQIWKVCWISKWYLITIALATDIKDVSKYEEVIKTFKCK